VSTRAFSRAVYILYIYIYVWQDERLIFFFSKDWVPHDPEAKDGPSSSSNGNQNGDNGGAAETLPDPNKAGNPLTLIKNGQRYSLQPLDEEPGKSVWVPVGNPAPSSPTVIVEPIQEPAINTVAEESQTLSQSLEQIIMEAAETHPVAKAAAPVGTVAATLDQYRKPGMHPELVVTPTAAPIVGASQFSEPTGDGGPAAETIHETGSQPEDDLPLGATYQDLIGKKKSKKSVAASLPASSLVATTAVAANNGPPPPPPPSSMWVQVPVPSANVQGPVPKSAPVAVAAAGAAPVAAPASAPAGDDKPTPPLRAVAPPDPDYPLQIDESPAIGGDIIPATTSAPEVAEADPMEVDEAGQTPPAVVTESQVSEGLTAGGGGSLMHDAQSPLSLSGGSILGTQESVAGKRFGSVFGKRGIRGLKRMSTTQLTSGLENKWGRIEYKLSIGLIGMSGGGWGKGAAWAQKAMHHPGTILSQNELEIKMVQIIYIYIYSREARPPLRTD